MFYALVGGNVITPFKEIKNGTVIISGDKIYEVSETDEVIFPPECEIIDVSGKIITPGFVDLLVHGGGGFGFADYSVSSYKIISEYFLSHGSTTILPSLYAKPKKDLLNDLDTLSKFILDNPNMNMRGIHMEGPFLNPVLKGAMNEEYLWKPSVELFKDIFAASRGLMKIMTIAPELDGALEVIRAASFSGVICSIGHSTANYEVIDKAIAHGAAHITHIFNAMKPFHHRLPSIITAALLRDELKIELIADTFHVHPAVIELLLKVKSSKNIVLITDSIRAGGMHEGEYHFADQKVVLKDNIATLVDGTLAGSTLTLNKAVKNIIETTNARITDAVRMATLNSSKVINTGRGIIAAGKIADLVVMDEDFEVEMTIMEGNIAYKKKLTN
ncbi:MAG: N-acetylglucosamine-6-phosphate deacetylase [Ignavibacteriales bacterium CG_4_9_14_3_um_filter_34_10]|nr:MAG: N-acetylglucosamine-6-phosphate deacetylase [Ignavibacteriales bacterium CG_4_9_14_3_um_filter_34_10]